MKHHDKLDVLLRAGCGGEGVRAQIRTVRDQIHRECVAKHFIISGVVRRNMVKNWYASLSYLLNDDTSQLYVGDNKSDWSCQATSLRDHAKSLLHGARRSMALQTDLANALTDLADLIESLGNIVDSVVGPWAPLLSALEERRAHLTSPVGTAGRPDDDANVHIVVKAGDVRALLATADAGRPTPPMGQVYTAFRTLGQAHHEYATGHAYVTPDDRIKAVIYNPPASLEVLKDSARAAGCRLFKVEVRLTDEVNLTPPKTREDVLREAALQYLPPDVAEDLLKRAGLPPF